MSAAADNILDAADELFVARGFAAVSVRDIAEAAQVAKALVFYHYDSKEALFAEVLERYYAAHAEAMAGPYAGEPAVRVHAVLDSYLDFLEGNHRYVKLVLREVLSGSASRVPIERGFGVLYAEFVQALEGLDLEPGGPRGPEQFFVTLAGLMTAYFVYAPVVAPLFAGDPLCAAGLATRREHIHWLVDRWLDGLGR